MERPRIDLERYTSVGSFPGSPLGTLRVWPLQQLFQTIGWYLVFERTAPAGSMG